MALNKSELRSWPHNGQPSALHVWKLKSQGGLSGHVAQCERCGRSFVERADTRGPVYCYPTPAWLAAHPGDDGALGILPTGERGGEYGRRHAPRA